MELRAEVRMRNPKEGTDVILCTNVPTDLAIKWVDVSMQQMDLNNMPEYVIRPMISKQASVRKESQHGNVATTKQVQKPQG